MVSKGEEGRCSVRGVHILEQAWQMFICSCENLVTADAIESISKINLQHHCVIAVTLDERTCCMDSCLCTQSNTKTQLIGSQEIAACSAHPLTATLEIRRLRVLPMAIGRTPPSFFLRAQRDAPKKIDLISCGTHPSSTRLTKWVRDFSSLDSCSRPLLPTKSLRCCGLSPSRPPPEPFGNERIAWSTSDLSV